MSLYDRMTEVLTKIDARAAAACPPGALGHSDQIPYEYAAELIREALAATTAPEGGEQRED